MPSDQVTEKVNEMSTEEKVQMVHAILSSMTKAEAVGAMRLAMADHGITRSDFD